MPDNNTVTITTPYEDLLRKILAEGTHKNDRTGTGTTSLFAQQLRFDLAESFPLITTKQVHFHSVVGELLWFLSGSSNVAWLQENGIRIWNEWADDQGELGPVYGVQWRSWPTPDGGYVDQISASLAMLRADPDSRRNIVSAWNVGELPKMALPPCHLLFQLYVADNRLSCQVYQRSADMFLGVPFNIASYALLLMMTAQVTDLEPGDFIYTTGDTHLYLNHLEQARLQLTRTPGPLPTMRLNPERRRLEDFRYEDFELIDYNPQPHIAAPVSV